MKERGKIQTNKGITVLELIVVAALIGLITAISLGSYYEFSSRIVVSTLAQDIASSVRTAQSYGLNVKGLGGGATPFDTSYGIHFEDADNYELFRDNNRANGNPTLADGAVLQTFTINRPFQITSIRGVRSGGAPIDTLTWVDIGFDRPDPDAAFTTNTGQSYEQILIDITDTRSNDTKTVEILVTGFIGVQ